MAALLFVSAPGLWVTLAGLQLRLRAAGSDLGARDLIAAGVGSALLVLAAVVTLRRGRFVSWMVLLAVLLGHLSPVAHAREAPALALVGWVWAAFLVYLAQRESVLARREDGPRPWDAADAIGAPAVLGSGLLTLVLASYGAGIGALGTTMGRFAVTALLLSGAGVASAAEFRLARRNALKPKRDADGKLLQGRVGQYVFAGILAALSLSAFFCLVPGDSRLPIFGGLCALRLLVAVVGAARAHELRHDVSRMLWSRPALLVVVTFLLLSAVGGLILSFPASSASGEGLEPIDALFTAVSACCVTGLSVRDTAVDFSLIGQVTILCLIQIGALGIMTLSAFATLLLGSSLGARAEGALREVVGTERQATTKRMVFVIVRATILFEICGALLLLPGFATDGVGFGEAAWKAGFHAISAFCNAGFALQSDSLMSLQGNGLAVHVVALLVILGRGWFRCHRRAVRGLAPARSPHVACAARSLVERHPPRAGHVRLVCLRVERCPRRLVGSRPPEQPPGSRRSPCGRPGSTPLHSVT